MSRILLYDRYDNPLPDLDPRKVASAFYEEELNGEHSIEIDTYEPLDEGTHVLQPDGTGKWREWVIDEPGDEHDGTYSCEQSGTWSMQYDLAGISGSELWASGEAGTHAPVTAAVALQIALSDQSRWEVGNVTVTGYGAASLYDGSVWDYLGKLVEVWGGEMEPRIVVDSSLGVTHRYVDWLAHVGSETATRRFDYGEDCTRIRRRPKPGPRYCGIRPRGGSTATDQDGVDYSNRVGIEEEPSCEGHDLGSPYLYDLAAKDDFKRPDGHGGYEYPTLTVTYDSEDPEEILGLAQVDLHTYTRPEVSYEADVLQFAAAGMDAHGVALGDYVHVVDRKFGVAPLRLEARVTKVRVSMLDESDIKLTIGSFNRLEETIGELVRATTQGIERRIGTIEAGGTIVYLNELLQQLNDELNVLGGHTYIVDGYGLISYDIAVDDPLIGYNSSTGTWASHVTQIMGGGIRIANSKKPSFAGINDWNWRTLIVSGHIAAELVTAVQITAGFIGNANGNFFLDLDNNVLSIGNNTQIGDTTVGDLLSDVSSAGISKVEYGTSSSSSATPTSWSQTAPTDVPKGSWLWVRTTYKDGTNTVTKAYAGEDGTSVSILGSYNTLADLQAAHPTGNVGDGYIVNGDLCVWDGSQWLNVGRIQGPAGQDGTSVTISSREVKYAQSSSGTAAPSTGWQDNPPSTSAGQYLWSRTTVNYNDGTNTVTYNVAGHGMDGTSVTITRTEYGISTDASSQPSSWSTTTPTSIAKGSWLWVRTTYSDGSSATSKSYVGTDGEDGTSVYVKSSTKSGDVTTVVITDGDSDTTLTIRDGDDGTNGVNGLNGYVHTAWANNATGTMNFSTTDSANKLYLGVYTDNVQADSQSPADYSWSLIKGANGAKGDKGDKGNDGAAARSYAIVVSPDVLRRDGNVISPSEITVSATVAVGAESPAIYMGRFRIEEYDGSAWAVKYTSVSNESSKTYQPTETARMIRATLFLAGGTTTKLDSQTVPVLSDGADGADGTNGINGSDSYSVWLTNDSHLFPASGAAALDGSVVTYIKAYKGTSPMRPVTIGTLPTPPTGMTLTKLNNGSSTTDAGIRVSVTTSLVTRSGTIDIPITTDGKSFTATFSWALALEGTGVKSVVPQYYLSTSSTTATGGSWSSTPPTWSSGKYIWTRNFITWDSSPIKTSTTDEVYDAALTQANQQAAQARTEAAEAAKVATNYLTFNQSNGLDVGYSGTSAKVRVNGSGMTVYDGYGNDSLNVAASYVRVGRDGNGHSRVVVTDDGMSFKNIQSQDVFFVGYDEDYDPSEPISVLYNVMRFGLGLIGRSDWQTILGKYNVVDSSDTYPLIIGGGASNTSRKNILTVDWSGNVNANGGTMTGTVKIKDNSINRDASPSSTLYSDTHALDLVDKDGELAGRIRIMKAPNGTMGLQLIAWNEPDGGGTVHYNMFGIQIGKDGSKSYTMSDPAAFRSAIVSDTTTSAGWEDNVDDEAAVSVIYFQKTTFTARKIYGRIVQFYLSGKLGNECSAGGTVTLGKLPAGYCPALQVGANAHSVTRRATVTTSGVVTIQSSVAIANNATVTVSGIFITAS